MAKHYDTGWERGEWSTNTNADEFERCVIWGQPNEFERMSHDGMMQQGYAEPRTDLIMGPPDASDTWSVEQLEDMGLCGVYKIDDTASKLTLMAKEICNSIGLGPAEKIGGAGWWLELDKRRMSEYSDTEFETIMSAIAGFIEDGQTQGITPYWKLHLSD